MARLLRDLDDTQPLDNQCRKLAPTQETPSPAQRAKDREELLTFSACMRKNGVPEFPDPKFNPDGSGGISIGANSSLDPDSPQFKAAEKACEERRPAGANARADPWRSRDAVAR
jgi:hypothetical protein